jgi:capsid assembly protease
MRITPEGLVIFEGSTEGAQVVAGPAGESDPGLAHGLLRPRCPKIAAAVMSSCWALEEDKLLAIAEFVQARAVHGFDRQFIFDKEDHPPRAAVKTAVRAGSIAVLPLIGTIVPRVSMLAQMSGATGLHAWMEGFREAVADPNVGGILIDIMSPGGSAFGIQEAGDEIRAARSKKPVYAIANHYAFSAAYWLGAQASEFIVSPSGQVGSIGVISVHEDQSGMNEMLGLKYTIIRSVPAKAEASEMERLSPGARQDMQSKVDTYHEMFVSAVAAGRRVSAATVNADFGQGRTKMAKEALKAGMVDRIDTFENVLQGMLGQKGGRNGAAAEEAEQPQEGGVEAGEQVEALPATAPPFAAELDRLRMTLQLEALR